MAVFSKYLFEKFFLDIGETGVGWDKKVKTGL